MKFCLASLLGQCGEVYPTSQHLASSRVSDKSGYHDAEAGLSWVLGARCQREAKSWCFVVGDGDCKRCTVESFTSHVSHAVSESVLLIRSMTFLAHPLDSLSKATREWGTQSASEVAAGKANLAHAQKLFGNMNWMTAVKKRNDAGGRSCHVCSCILSGK